MTPETTRFVVYGGPSMNPTLRDPELLEIRPYGHERLRVGDVVYCQARPHGQPIVHRVARVTPAGIATLGDNNTREDAVLLRPGDIHGRVVAAWRGQQRRQIAGGLRGRLTSLWRRSRRIPGLAVSRLLHPLYDRLSRSGVVARFVPSALRPRIVAFHAQGRDQLRLVVRKQIVGRFNDQTRRWQIRWPFRLAVDERVLQRQRADGRTGAPHRLALADGSHWEIAAEDQDAARVVSHLAGAMQLRADNTGAAEPRHRGLERRLIVVVDRRNPGASQAECHARLSRDDTGALECVLPSLTSSDGLYLQLVGLSAVVARDAQTRGGILLHGALAARDGIGVILAGPSGTGKTTASDRLPAPWRSLCDDTTLVVRDPGGAYWAHPWPTWSRCVEKDSSEAWNVQAAVPLKGVFFLAQAVEDRVESIGAGHAASLFVECAKQTAQGRAQGMSGQDVRSLHLERFNSICTLAKAVPVHVLHISLTGSFWQPIEQMLGRHRYAGT